MALHFRLPRQAEVGEDIRIVGAGTVGCTERIRRQDDRYQYLMTLSARQQAAAKAAIIYKHEKVDTKIPVRLCKVAKDNAADIFKNSAACAEK